MVLCLFVGFLMAAGMMSTVPIYMDASLQRMLIKDMESYQTQTGLFPGQYTVIKTLALNTTAEQRAAVATDLPDFVKSRISKLDIPVANYKTIIKDDYMYISTGGASQRAKVLTMSDLDSHIKITKGRMFNAGAVDGVFEVICSDVALKTLGIVENADYNLVNSFSSSSQPITIRVVGVFEQSSETDSYWSETMDTYLNAFFMDRDTFMNGYIATNATMISEVSVRYSLDYQLMNLNDLGSVTRTLEDDLSAYPENGYAFEMGVYDILVDYAYRAESLKKILWVLQIPTIVMLGFYLFMVSQLNVEQEKNEIAVFKSRGASSKQVFSIYAMEAGILGIVTLIVAPFIGLSLCTFLGVSNGFLEFVNRPALAAKISLDAVIYALVAVAVFFITTMVPILPASKLSIVKYKQSKTKVVKMALWEKFMLDIILLGGSLGFFWWFTGKIGSEVAEGTFAGSGEIDPLFFIFAIMFIMGAGLLFIRVYPYILRLVYIIGKPFWSPAQYIAITTVSRSQGGRERFLMLFLVITFSFGIFSANTARAINNNKENRISYSAGADVVMTTYWTTVSGDENADYEELDFERFENLEGVETATKVLVVDDAQIKGNETIKDVTLMSVEPGKFANVAWFRNDLLPVHWWNYCNALTDYKSGVVVSSSLQEKGYQLGDELKVKWGKNETLELTILAFVDYWSGINPNELTSDGEKKDFVITNYNYIRKVTSVEPYEIWLKLKDGATSEALYNDIAEKRIPLETIKDTSQLIIEEKTDPSLQGMNGALTLGFVIIMIMTIIGFLIYWILSIKSRTLQFGVLRAMGVTYREVIATLAYEQLLVSGVSIIMAFIIGGIASDLFVPLFQTMYDVVDQIPPFRVAAMRSDYIKIYAIIVIMLGGGFAVLGNIIRKININKALKLGED